MHIHHKLTATAILAAALSVAANLAGLAQTDSSLGNFNPPATTFMDTNFITVIRKTFADSECFFLTKQFTESFLTDKITRDKYALFLGSFSHDWNLSWDHQASACVAMYQAAIATQHNQPLEAKRLFSQVGVNLRYPNDLRERLYVSKAQIAFLDKFSKDDQHKNSAILIADTIRKLTSFKSNYDDLEFERLMILAKLEKLQPASDQNIPWRTFVDQSNAIRDKLQARNTNTHRQIMKFQDLQRSSIEKKDYDHGRAAASQCLEYIKSNFHTDVLDSAQPVERLHSIKMIPALCTLFLVEVQEKANLDNVSEPLKRMEQIVEAYSPLRDATLANEDADYAIDSLNALLSENLDKIQTERIRKLICIASIKTCQYESIPVKVRELTDYLGDSREAFEIKCAAAGFFEITWHPEMAPAIWPH